MVYLLLGVIGASYRLAVSSIQPVVPLLAAELVPTGIILGLIISAQSLLPLFLAVPLGGLSDRIGQRITLVSGGAIMLVAGWLYAVAHTPGQLVAAQIVSGIGQLAAWLSVQSLVTSIAGSASERQRQIGNFTVCIAIGTFLGPAVGTSLLHRFGQAALFANYAALALVVAACAWFLPTRHFIADRQPAETDNWLTLHRTVAILRGTGMQATLVGTFIMAYLQDVTTSFFPLYLSHAGLSLPQIGTILSLSSLAAIAVRVVLVPLVRVWGIKRTLVAAICLATACIGVVPAFSTAAALTALAVLFRIGLAVNQPLVFMLIAETTPVADRGVSMGLRLMVNRMAQLTNPILFGFLAGVAGLGSAFVVSAFGLAGLTVALVAMLKRLTLPAPRSSPARE